MCEYECVRETRKRGREIREREEKKERREERDKREKEGEGETRDRPGCCTTVAEVSM